MRLISKLETATIIKPFIWKRQPRLTVGSMLAFELGEEDFILNEQRMIERVARLKTKEPITLDGLAPKMQGEWLVCGAAYPLDNNEGRNRCRVMVSVAGVEKELDVYGPRVWQNNNVASEPEVFLRQDVDWSATYPVAYNAPSPEGENAPSQPPAVFYPNQVQVHREQVVPSASFMPVSVSHPDRVCCQGTYDSKWLKECWPALPNDIDWRWFNEAPLDQRIEGYFKGGEPYSLVNMHPTEATITGTLPRHRPRIFIERKEKGQAEPVYHEVDLFCDTVWLLPEVNLGVMVFRGAVAIADEDARDVNFVQTALEAPSSEPLSLQDYLKESQRDPFKEAIDPKIMERADKEIANAKKIVADIPKLMRFKLAQQAGKIPVPLANMDESQGMMKEMLQGRVAGLDKMTAWLKEGSANSQVMNAMDNAKSKLLNMLGKFDELPKHMADADNVVKKHFDDTKKNLQARPEVPADMLEKLDMPPTAKSVGDAPKTWQGQANRLVNLAQHGLNHSHFKDVIAKHGLRDVSLQRYLLGYIRDPFPLVLEDWGVEPDSSQSATIGPGWLIPSFHNGDYTGLRVRPGDWDGNADADHMVPGGEFETWFSDLDGKPKLLIEDISLAIFIAQDVDTQVNVIYVPSVKEKLPECVTSALDEAEYLFVPVVEEKEILPWQEKWSQARPLLIEYESLRKRIKENEDIQSWIYPHLPQPIREPDPVKPEDFMEVAKAKAFRNLDAMMAQYTQHAPKFDANISKLPTAEQENVQKSYNMLAPSAMQKHVDDFKKALSAPAPTSPVSKGKSNPLEMIKDFRQNFKDGYSEAKKAINLEHAPEAMKKKLLDQQEQLEKSVHESMDELEEKFKDSARNMPDFKEDEKDMPYRKLSREDVIAAYEKGEEFKRVDLSGVDLSDLDLPKIVLDDSLLRDAIVRRSNFSQGSLKNVIGPSADFSDSNLDGVDLKDALMEKCYFINTSLKGTKFNHTLVKEAVFDGANLKDAILTSTIAEKTSFRSTVFDRTILKKAVLIYSDFVGCRFDSCNLDQVLFLNTDLRNTVFNRCCGIKSSFWQAELEDAEFTHCHLENARFGPANMRGARFNRTYLFRANFAGTKAMGADFSLSDMTRIFAHGADFTQARFEHTDLREAKLDYANFESADMKGSNLIYASLKKARLTGANCEGVNFYESFLYHITIGDTNFQGANLKKTLLSDKGIIKELESESA